MYDFDAFAGAIDEVTACKRLICHIIHQAVEDYRMLEQKGVIYRGRVKAGEMAKIVAGKAGTCKAVGRGLQQEFSAKLLLIFLNRDMDLLIDLAHLENITGDAIREQLGIPGPKTT